jgi:hypothetical protein
MTKVRVREETSNLNHSSNPISILGLRNSSPSLMTSIRARGRTHSWVVHAFLLREQERARERSSLRRDNICRRRAHIPKQITGTDLEAADNKEEQVVRYRFLEVVQH